jgi:glyoxylase-like metal-dependent hydrolase (beta-lactamase superfamily II)
MMIHLGVAHTDDSSVLYFPDERTVFSADVLQVKRLPQSIAPSIGAYIDALRTILALDFDHAATGHALMGTKKDAAQSLQYLEDLSNGVAAGIAAGRSLPEIQKSLMLDAYKGFERWDTHRTVHIAQLYEAIKGSRPAPGATRTN